MHFLREISVCFMMESLFDVLGVYWFAEFVVGEDELGLGGIHGGHFEEEHAEGPFVGGGGVGFAF